MMVSMEPRMLSNENEVEEGLSNHLGGGEGGEEDDGDWLENAADLHSFTKVKSQPTLTARPGWFSSTAGDPTYICKGAKSAIFRPSSKFTPFLQTILKPRNGVSRVLQHLVRKTDQKSIHTQALWAHKWTTDQPCSNDPRGWREKRRVCCREEGMDARGGKERRFQKSASCCLIRTERKTE
ncbi:uncharacterized protein LOC112161763 isoform X1 [Oryzias melastigma]|uniref:uncharacterized protein LOC112161763 isoform X1 n=1 Tax=Oryzias melastigma TaxID=30732 RepID=UPI00168D3D4B|nr:uncharacterized protein LOC112161763 isoform X1 [Oryzias melastigma]